MEAAPANCLDAKLEWLATRIVNFRILVTKYVSRGETRERYVRLSQMRCREEPTKARTNCDIALSPAAPRVHV